MWWSRSVTREHFQRLCARWDNSQIAHARPSIEPHRLSAQVFSAFRGRFSLWCSIQQRQSVQRASDSVSFTSRMYPKLRFRGYSLQGAQISRCSSVAVALAFVRPRSSLVELVRLADLEGCAVDARRPSLLRREGLAPRLQPRRDGVDRDSR